MGEDPKFVNSFWVTDFLSTDGFDVLHQRMKDSKQFMDDVTKFLATRASIEEQYAKALGKLAKSAGGTTEIASMRQVWDTVVKQTSVSAERHMRLATDIAQEVEAPLKQLRETQRSIRKKLEDTLKKAQKLKAQRFAQNEKAKKTYDSKCREAEKAEDESNRNATLPQKDIDRLKAKARKCKLASESADAAYQDAVQQLDHARILWEKEMEACCNYFQEMEEERVDQVRRKLWELTNYVSDTCVAEDEYQEAMRASLEKCSVADDIQFFISNNKRGGERPAPIRYKSFYQVSAPPANSDRDSSGGGEIVQAIYDYEKQGDLEMSLKKGDKIKVIQKESETWWKGEKLSDGTKGMFPSTYAKPSTA